MLKMKISLPRSLVKFAKSLPYSLYVVGGRVREALSGCERENSDVDICAPATVKDISARAKKFGFTAEATYGNTGTVKFSDGENCFEYACFRSDEYVRGRHVPEEVAFTDDINLDAIRRDFKCNAVYYDIAKGQIVDPLGGIKDIEEKKISTVAPAKKVFGEDGLRLMRLARIAAQTGFTPTAQCLEGARENAALIADISAERIYEELTKILSADKRYGIPMGHYYGLKVLHTTGVMAYILPELTAGESIEQRKDFHRYNVLEHSLRAAAYADESVRLAALLHDVGKPYCFNACGNFVSHGEEGEKIAAKICKRLKVPKKLAAETVKLVGLHMFDFQLQAKENRVRKFIIENIEYYRKLLLVMQADFSACKDDLSRAPVAAKLENVYNKMREEGVAFRISELNIKGDDLLRVGFPPASIGKVLKFLLLDGAINLVPNEREKLIMRAVKVYLKERNLQAYLKYAEEFAKEREKRSELYRQKAAESAQKRAQKGGGSGEN